MTMKIKTSKYNHIFSYSDGLELAYNALSGSILNLNEGVGNRIKEILSGSKNPSLDDELLQTLVDHKFLVDNDVNELNIVKYLFTNKNSLIKKSLALTILPTLGCNFGCNYCFERHIKGFMSNGVQDALIKFLTSKLIPFGNALSIDWFGGEPLLGISVIESLSKRLKEVCRRSHVNLLPANITTNGYLLSHNMAHKLLDLGITSAQITIDGTPEVHNRRRPLVNGKGSFEKIIENIKEVMDIIQITIRINVDGHNKEHVFDLIKFLYEENLIPKVKPYVARVESYSEECRSSEGGFLTSQQFASFQKDLQYRCKGHGIPWLSNSSPRLNACGFCMVDNINAFVIEPSGRILKCWAEAGNNKGTEIAHLLKEDTWDRFTVSPLQKRDPFDDQECCDCRILPLCMGGCPRTREDNRLQGFKECPSLRYSLSNDIRNMYNISRS